MFHSLFRTVYPPSGQVSAPQSVHMWYSRNSTSVGYPSRREHTRHSGSSSSVRTSSDSESHLPHTVRPGW